MMHVTKVISLVQKMALWLLAAVFFFCYALSFVLFVVLLVYLLILV